MLTGDTLNERINNALDGISHDHQEAQSMCVVLHQDLGLGTTSLPEDEMEDIRGRLREAFGDEWEQQLAEMNKGIDLTVEHRALHESLDALFGEAVTNGVVGSQLVALLVSVGFRLGRMDAAETLNGARFDANLLDVTDGEPQETDDEGERS